MNWIDRIKMKKICFVVMINILSVLFVIVLMSFLIRGFLSTPKATGKSQYDTNTIRATYPNYKNLSEEKALAIFNDYAKPGSSYSAFTGWRRTAYDGPAVKVDSEFNTRTSVNHAVDGSVWFLGGSTMWGTGSSDDQTIPSYFAKKTGEKVLNLGESGYNSFQELIQLQILLAKGFKPKAVIFYDGVNDTIYCNANAKNIPTHSRFDQYSTYVKEFRKNVSEIERLRKQVKLLESNGTIVFDDFARKKLEYIWTPYKSIFEKYSDNRAIGIPPSSSLLIVKKYTEFKKENKYKVCGDNHQRAVNAAKTTVNTWLIAYDVLESRGVPVYFVLQPTSHIKSNGYMLDYILDTEKQRIVDERESYEKRYIQTKKIWAEYCEKSNACDMFFDLSEIFIGINEPVFIDAVHVSPNGNKYVAEKIAEFMEL